MSHALHGDSVAITTMDVLLLLLLPDASFVTSSNDDGSRLIGLKHFMMHFIGIRIHPPMTAICVR